MLVSDQITFITTSYNMLTMYRCGVRARQHHAVQADLTALAWLPWSGPTRRLDMDRLGFSRCWKSSTTNHYRTDGGVPGGAALSVMLTAKRARTIKLICSLFGILFC